MKTLLTARESAQNKFGQWTELARALVISEIDQEGGLVSLEVFLDSIGFTLTEWEVIRDNPVFEKMVEAERLRAKEFGPEAATVYRSEDYMSKLEDILMTRIMDNPVGVDIKDIQNAMAYFAKKAGKDAPASKKKEELAAMGGTSVMIVIPPLQSNKLSHLASATHVVVDGEAV